MSPKLTREKRSRQALTAILLVGGEGTRMRPLTEQMPKPMLPILGRPLLSYTFEALASSGVRRAVLSCGYLPDQIKAYFGNDFAGLDLEYTVEPERLGTAGGVRFAAEGLAETFVALNGDTLREARLEELLERHRRAGAEATILLAQVSDPTRYGLVRTDDDGRVRGFLEKPRPEEIDTDLINAGLYILEPSVLDLIEPDRQVSIEREVFPILADRGTLFGSHLPGYWLDVGTPESYLQAHWDILALRGGVSVAPGSSVDAGAELVAPVLVEEGAVVEAGARVGPFAYLGPGARVETQAVAEQTVVLDGGVIAAGDRVRSAIVARETVLAAV
jgi:mannose-1-phosphate guanylyltransferase